MGGSLVLDLSTRAAAWLGSEGLRGACLAGKVAWGSMEGDCVVGGEVLERLCGVRW